MNRTKRWLAILLAIVMVLSAVPVSAAQLSAPMLSAMLAEAKAPMDLDAVLDSYNVVWETQSKNSSESMPVGGHDVGLNVWVQDNAIYFYIGKSDAMDENNMLAKLGRVKLTLDPSPFGEGKSFRQELLLRDGYVRITGEDDAGQPVTVDIWVDVYQPVIHVEVNGQTETKVTAEYQSWRYEDREYAPGTVPGSMYEFSGYPGTITTHKDTISAKGQEILFYHKNDNSDLAMNKIIQQQQLEGKLDMDSWYDPVTDFTFGGLMRGDGMVAAETTSDGSYNNYAYRAWSLTSAEPVKSQSLEIGLHTGQYETVENWQTDLLKAMEASDSHEESIQWWHDFWERSHVINNPGAGESDTAWQVTRNYALFRYMLGCNEYGNLPSKFNGGMFTWDNNGDPDFRNWGGAPMTAQNQRHLYWPMLKSGDFEAMLPEFDFYNNSYHNGEQAVKAYWGHEGTVFEEYPSHYCLPAGSIYGWSNRDGLEPGVMEGSYIRYEYVHQLDFASMILEYHRYTGEDISRYVGFLESAVRFYLDHYRMRYQQYTESQGAKDEDGYDENGKLVIYPSTAVETYKNVLNPNDVIAALTTVLNGLLDLSEEGYAVDAATWEDMLGRLPDLTVEDSQYGKVYMPGQHPGEMGINSPYYGRGDYFLYNVEAPQLSIVYPFNLVSQGRDGADIARNTWNTLGGGQLSATSWQYVNIVAARLGMTKEAQQYTVQKLSNGPCRFPSFWGPGHDWIPDHNWGGTGMMGLQEMALQCYDNVIQPYGAWPAEWDNEFKLHALMDTVVEGKFEDGQIQHVKITVEPGSARKDVVFQYPGAATGVVVDAQGNLVDTRKTDDNTITFAVEAGKTYYVLGIESALTAPQGLTALREEDGTVALSWQEVPGADSYTVYRRSAQDGTGLEVLEDGLTQLAFTDADTEESGIPYYYAVSAVRGQKEGPLSAECPIQSWGEIVWYQFEDGENLGKDTLNHANGTPAGAPVSGAGSEGHGNALVLDGGSYISVPHNDSIALDGSFRLEVEICPTAYGNYTRIVDKYGAPGVPGNGFIVDLSPSGNIRFLAPLAFEDTFFVTKGTAPVGEWTKISIDFDYSKSLASVYLNDQLDSTVALTGRLLEVDCPLRIGADQSGSSTFTGLIDELKIEGMTSEQASGELPPEVEDGVLAVYHFQNLGQQAEDASGNDNHGTVTEGVSSVSGGVYGKAAQFDGAGSITVPASSTLSFTDNFAVELYANPEGTSGKLAEKTGAFMLELADGAVQATVGSQSLTSAPLPTGEFTRILLTVSGGKAALTVGADTQTTELNEELSGSGDLVLGDGYTGLLDELEIRPYFAPADTVDGLRISTDRTALFEGETAQLTVTGTVGGASKDLTGESTFASDNENVLSVDASGVVTAHKAGHAVITAETEGKRASVVLSVSTNEANKDLYLWYTGMEDGEIPDASGNGLDGTVGSGVSAGQGLFGGGGLSFEGANCAALTVELDQIIENPVDKIAFELWTYDRNLSGDSVLMESYTNGSCAFFLDVLSGGAVRVLGYDRESDETETYVNLITQKGIQANVWNHIKVTVDSEGSGITVYINGKVAAEQELKGQMRAATGPLYIGGRHDNASRPYDGLMDEIRIYSYDEATAPVLESLELIVDETDVLYGQSTNVRVEGTLSDGSIVDLTPIATFDTEDVTVTQEGVLTKNVNGEVIVTATASYDGVEKTSEPVILNGLAEYTIEASASGSGSIDPAGTVTVEAGAEQTFTFSPKLGYEVSRLLVDGQNVPVDGDTYNYTFESVDRNHTIRVTFAEKPALAITTAELPEGVTGGEYAAQITCVGGIDPLTFTADGLPEGLHLDDRTGRITGTPLVYGDFPVRISVADQSGQTDEAELTLTIHPSQLLITTVEIGNVRQYRAYEGAIRVVGGKPPYEMTAQGLPDGLTLDQDGTLHGAALQSGRYAVDVTVTDAQGKEARRTVTLTVQAAAAGVQIDPSITHGTVTVTPANPKVGETVTIQTQPETDYRLKSVSVNAGTVAVAEDGTFVMPEGGVWITAEFEQIPPHVHELVKTEAKKPTCTERGNIEYWYCEGCGKYYRDEAAAEEITKEQTVIEALGHTEEVLPAKAPTCTETGLTEGKKCSACGEILVAQEIIPATGHTEEVLPGKAPTCTETGLTEGKKCSVCGEILVAQEVIAATGHKAETVAGKEPTCTETGLTEGSKCSVCGEILKAQEEIPALGHNFTDWAYNADQHWKTCSRCDAVDVTSREAHKWVEDEERSGEKTVWYTCECGAEKSESRVTATPTYILKAEQSEGGKISPSSCAVNRGDEVEFSITPDSGYRIADVLVDGRSVGAVSEYTFKNIGSHHTITAQFTNGTAPVETVKGFTDVTVNDWFADAVEYVVENGLMKGTSDTTFSPKGDTTRGMIVTILYRLAGSPKVKSDGAAWWSDAHVWAMENGISDGTNMEGKITREQLAAMLYRYAGSPEIKGDLSAFADADKVSDWATDALIWATANEIVTGKTGNVLDPDAGATRAETATMLMRYGALDA